MKSNISLNEKVNFYEDKKTIYIYDVFFLNNKITSELLIIKNVA